MYTGASTNYSNVNMAAIGLATLGRFETDPYVRDRFVETLTTQFWNAGSDRDASHVEQAWFDAIEGAYDPAASSTLSDRIENHLGGYPAAPCIERDRINCDDAEIAAGSCLAIDGTTTITLLSQPGHGDSVVAKDVLPMSIRPDSDFVWRSDPHSPNGGANTKMDPRGDWLAAYWLARASELGAPILNLSPHARAALPYTLAGAGGGGAGGGGGTGGMDDGCGCRVAAHRESSTALVLGLGLGALAARRRQKRGR
jgi:MYXO-CTERM domain-containing protein